MKKILIFLVLVFCMVGCGDKVDEKGFYTEGSKTGINKETGTEFDISGFNKTGYNEYGFDIDGYDRDGFDKNKYDKNGFNANGFNREKTHKETGSIFDETGFDIDGFDKDGYSKTGYDKNHYDRNGLNVWGYDREGYYRDDFKKINRDKNGFDKDGFDLNGFDTNKKHKDTKKYHNGMGFDYKGIHIKTKKKYNENGYNVNFKNISEIINTSFFIENFVNEFKDKTDERYVGYKGDVKEVSENSVKTKSFLMAASNAGIFFTLSPLVFLNYDNPVRCFIEVDGKNHKKYFNASKDKFFITKQNNKKEYEELMSLFKNGKNLKITVYNYNDTIHYVASFDLKGFKELSEIVGIN